MYHKWLQARAFRFISSIFLWFQHCGHKRVRVGWSEYPKGGSVVGMCDRHKFISSIFIVVIPCLIVYCLSPLQQYCFIHRVFFVCCSMKTTRFGLSNLYTFSLEKMPGLSIKSTVERLSIVGNVNAKKKTKKRREEFNEIILKTIGSWTKPQDIFMNWFNIFPLREFYELKFRHNKLKLCTESFNEIELNFNVANYFMLINLIFGRGHLNENQWGSMERIRKPRTLLSCTVFSLAHLKRHAKLTA